MIFGAHELWTSTQTSTEVELWTQTWHLMAEWTKYNYGLTLGSSPDHRYSFTWLSVVTGATTMNTNTGCGRLPVIS